MKSPLLPATLLALTLSAAPTAEAQAQPATCPSATMNKPFFEGIKTSSYAVPAGFRASDISAVLLACLASPDSELRDRYGYEILARWMRSGTLNADDLHGMVRTLLPNLNAGLGENGSESAFRRTFSALVLAELLGQDNRTPYLQAAEFKAVLDAGLAYLKAERDLRGFDPKYGYVHGVAHASDILYRAAQSTKLDRADIPRILDAVLSKVAPAGQYAYVHGEDERLVRPLVALINRELLSKDDLNAFLKRVTDPAPLASWDAIWFDPAGLAKRHNTKLFLLSLNMYLTLGGVKNGADYVPVVNEALNRLP